MKLITQLWTMQKILIIALPMYNLLEYSDHYSMTGSLWNYDSDEVNDDVNEIDGADNNSENNKKDNK